MPKQIRCPKCKTEQPLSDRCVSCGLNFREYARRLKEKRAAQGAAPRRVKCPQCKAAQPLGVRCVNCGLDFKEYLRKKKAEREARGAAPAEAKTAQGKRPAGKPGVKSAVDAEPRRVQMPVFEREPELSGIAELLSSTWLIYRGRSPVLIGIYVIALAAMAVPVLVSSLIGSVAMVAIGLWPAVAIGTVGGLIGTVAFVVFFGGVISASCDETQKFGEAVGRGWRNLWPLFWLYLLVACVVQGGLLLLVVPGVVWAVSFFAAQFIVFEEGIKGMPAMLKSRAYVSGHWRAVFLRLLVIMFIVSAISAVQWLVSLVMPAEAMVVLVPVFGFAGLLWHLAFTPFMVVYMSLLYKELRAMKGTDVEFEPSGGSRKMWAAVAVAGAVVPLIIMLLGGMSIYKSAPDMGELRQMVQNEMARIESSKAPPPAPKQEEAPSGPAALIEPELTLDKTSYVAGERMRVAFRAPSTFAADAWVGIVPSSVPHGFEAKAQNSSVSRQILGGLTSGELGFAVPSTPGIYDMRMYDSDDRGNEVASETFAVESHAGTREQRGSPVARAGVKTLKRTYAPGEPVMVEFTGLPGNRQDWVTLVPLSAPETTQGEWFYTGGLSSGRHGFSGLEPGSYEVRVYYDWPQGGYNVRMRHSFTVR